MSMRNTQSGGMGTKAAERGFALLFAVLTASVLLSVGLSIFNLTVKELVLSSSGRESQFAFYAADTGIECALYWDLNATNIFATSSGYAGRNPDPSNPDCVATSSLQFINITPSQSVSNAATTTFSIVIPNTDQSGASAPYCATVVVSKFGNGSIITTNIDSRGYNTCDTSDPNRVERAIRVKY